MGLAVSVVVPTFRRPDSLERCLRALRQQDFPSAELEVIVADDAGDERTRRRVERVRRAGGLEVRYLRVLGRHGPAAARNRGWRAARAGVIAFTDDDCVPDPGWLREGLEALRRGPAAVSGRVEVPLPEQPTDYERDAAGLAQAGFVTANCFCRRQALVAIGGLDERFEAPWREDSDLCFSLLERGFAVGSAPRAVVVHPVRPARWGVCLLQQRKIQYDALLYRKHPRLYRARVRRAPRWDYYLSNALLAGGLAGWVSGAAPLAWGAGTAWTLLTARLCGRRLSGTSRRPSHVLEMALTSALIPTLSVFWRAVGALRFRALLL